MLPAELVHPVQNNELDVVVGFLDSELNELGGCCLDSHGIACESCERGGRFIDDCARGGFEELEDEAEVSSLDKDQYMSAPGEVLTSGPCSAGSRLHPGG